MSDADDRRRIDEALGEWRQGDFVLGKHWFLHRVAPDAPLTAAAQQAADEGFSATEAEVVGLMVVTQSCDIIRECERRPFVQVCPIVEVDEEFVRQVRRGYRPNYAWVPGFGEELLVADLDRVMTVEKSVVAGWERNAGCEAKQDARRLALMLMRKVGRPAFPDDFATYAADLQARISSKHDKASDEGRALRALDEIRVRAAPSWDASTVELTFFFIRDPGQPLFEGKGWDAYLEKWLDLLPPSDHYTAYGIIVTLDDLTARDYADSDPLDLEHLSTREP